MRRCRFSCWIVPQLIFHNGGLRVNQQMRHGLATALIVLILDQASKWYLLISVMQPPQVIPVLPFFSLVSAWNRGISFGMFNSGSPYSGLILSGLATAIVIFLLNWLRKSDRKHISIAIGLIIGGAVGNIVDRAVHGAVYDFLDIFIGSYHWPAFNVADSGITIGAAILVLDSVLSKAENGESKDSPEKP